VLGIFFSLQYEVDGVLWSSLNFFLNPRKVNCDGIFEILVVSLENKGDARQTYLKLLEQNQQMPLLFFPATLAVPRIRAPCRLSRWLATASP